MQYVEIGQPYIGCLGQICVADQHKKIQYNMGHLVREGDSSDKKFFNGGKWLFWKVLMGTIILQNFKSWPLEDFESMDFTKKLYLSLPGWCEDGNLRSEFVPLQKVVHGPCLL